MTLETARLRIHPASDEKMQELIANEEGGGLKLGYGILPAFQNRGCATEAVKTITAWALSQANVRCIIAETEEDNAASKRVLLKSGFTPTGTYGEEGPLFRLKKDDLK